MSGAASKLEPPSGTAELRRLASGGMLNLLGAVVSAGCQFLLVLLVTRSFSTSIAGQFFTVTSVFLLLVGLGRLGAGTGLVFHISRMRALDDHRMINACLRIALTPVVLACVGLSAMLFVWAPEIARTFVGDDATSATYLRWLAFFLPFAAVLEALLGATRGYGNMKATVLIEKSARPLMQVGGLAIIAVTGGTSLLAFGWALPYLPAAVAASVWLIALRRSDSPRVPPGGGATLDHPGLARRYWGFTAPRAVAALGQVALQRLDVVIIAAVLGPTDAALYVAATRLVALGTFGVQAIAMAVQPQVATHFVRGELSAVNGLYRVSTAWLMLVTWPLYLMAIVFAPTLLTLFGPQYATASAVLVILALASLFSSSCGVVDVMLTMAGKSTWILANVMVALAVNVGLNLVLVPAMGIEGAAVAWASSIAINNILPLTQLWLSLRLHPFGRAMFCAGGAAVLAYCPAAALTVSAYGQSGTSFWGTAVIGSMLYVGLVSLFRSTLRLEVLMRIPGDKSRRSAKAEESPN